MNARRVSPLERNRCLCGNRAIYPRPRGGVAARADHPLCTRCWRSELNRAVASGARFRRDPGSTALPGRG